MNRPKRPATVKVKLRCPVYIVAEYEKLAEDAGTTLRHEMAAALVYYMEKLLDDGEKRA